MKYATLHQSKFTTVKEPTSFELETRKINSSRDGEKIFRMCYDIIGLPVDLLESFFVLYLNRQNNVISFQHLSTGGTAGCVVDPKPLFKQGLELMAHGIILCHNHPSGNLKPSTQDIGITNQLKAGAKLLDMTILDHLILTEDSYFSFADEGMM